ncbi:unnamed protein product [Mytilus coruscus]|uniref:IgGFc-binding protein N-terminal domain-containing protein n=1 Tax=Mytilus coruscus TaxID=42192 RepID=A0A6J8CGP4_MYTCO|nr:unnamed protein product [Mytilus coruscus]
MRIDAIVRCYVLNESLQGVEGIFWQIEVSVQHLQFDVFHCGDVEKLIKKRQSLTDPILYYAYAEEIYSIVLNLSETQETKLDVHVCAVCKNPCFSNVQCSTCAQYIHEQCSKGNMSGKDNKGKHFIFGFMDNLAGAVPEVFITTDCRCTVNVNISTPLYNTSFFESFSLNKHEVYNFAFNPSIQGGPGILLNNKGIEIKSDKEIAVYAVNKAIYSTDAFVVLPLDTLGVNYYVITWSNQAEFMIIATEQNTKVWIVIAKGTNIRYNGVTYTSGMTLNISMNRYQTFHVHGGPDYTGTRISSNNPITVISGAYCTRIGSGACDHLSSQLTPVETLGNTFVTISMPNCYRPVNFKIVTSENDTGVNITGIAHVNLSEPGDKYLFQITDQSSKLVSSTKPIAIAFFAEGGCGLSKGDPAMILLQPTQQFAADYTFTTIDYPTNSFNDALTIVIPEKEIGGLKLDGLNISANWRSIDGSNDLQITDINVTKGAHTIYHVNSIVTFLAVSTGIADYNSYGYSSGQRLAPINSNCTPSITVPGDIIDNDCDGLIDEELQDGIEIVGENLSTDMLIAGVLSALFALSCFSTAMYFLQRKLKGKNGQVEDVFQSISSNNIPPVHSTVHFKV